MASAAIATGRPLSALAANARRPVRAVVWALILLPYLVPVVLVGYVYARASLALIRLPLLNELLYDLLLLIRFVPVAVVVLHFAPSQLSREARHCRRLLFVPTRRDRRPVREVLSFFIHGPARKLAVAWAVVFLFAFAEFELANLMNVRTWTRSLFDAHAGGLALTESIRLAALPILCEGAVLLLVCGMLFAGRASAEAFRERPPVPGRPGRWFARAWIVLAASVGAGYPLAVVIVGAFRGLNVLRENLILAKDIAASLLFAVCAAVVTYTVAGWFAHRPKRPDSSGLGRLVAAFVLSLPGLLGALVLGLVVLSLFQWTPLRAAYDTPLPLVTALVLWLFPFAVLLRVLLYVLRPGPAVHVAGLPDVSGSVQPSVRRRARALLYELKTRPRFWVLFLLFFWAYFELVVSALLAPSGMTPAPVRLYNMMHYGQIAGLSAMVFVAFLVPFVLLALTAGVRHAA
ncbi:MAG TPA: hypothetical protein VMY39_00545, partial [Planctomycetota bacterium]|nr:hypothetical protein [Planctomycetota bacterium]